MLVCEKIEDSGKFLFRWRGYLPLFFLLLVVVTMYFNERMFFSASENEHMWKWVCLFVGCIGIVIRVFAVSFVPYKNSGRGTDDPYAESLNTTGMYSIMRNPVYFGNFFTFLAPVLYAQNIWLVLVYVPVFALYHERIIAAEEKFLLGMFGSEYRNWVDQTPIFFPDFSKWKKPDRVFNWKMAYRRESISLFTLIATIWGLEVFYGYITEHRFVCDMEMIFLLAVSAFFYLLNCVLVKFTKWLDI